ncbi:hypothetical protein [Lysinibacillus fusiformis]|uniref:hypothetical protein n=1 Tax=Lysinibacillus fusiformis TaxID=28031 RepID=UPI0034E1AE9C
MKNFKINKKYKVKLRYKQPPIYIYFLIPMIGLVFLLFCFTLEKAVLMLNGNFSFPTHIYIVGTLITIILTLFSIYKSPISFSKIQRLKFKMKKIIEENKFYYENEKRIVSSMLIKFYWLENDLFLEVYPQGGKYSLKMDDLTLMFQTSLNLTVISVQNDYPNHTKYILSDSLNNFIDSTNEWEL